MRWGRTDAARVDAFLDHCGPMVAFFEQHTALQFVDGNAIPDMRDQLPGAATRGHQVAAAPFDGRSVGHLIHRLSTTMRETAFLGMPIMAGADLTAFLTITRSARSVAHVAQRVGRHLLDLAVHGRAMQLVNAVALIARLALSAQVMGSGGTPVPGLYAVGADMASVMGGRCPSGGINLGSALTFGHIAGLHAAGRLPFKAGA